MKRMLVILLLILAVNLYADEKNDKPINKTEIYPRTCEICDSVYLTRIDSDILLYDEDLFAGGNIKTRLKFSLCKGCHAKYFGEYLFGLMVVKRRFIFEKREKNKKLIEKNRKENLRIQKRAIVMQIQKWEKKLKEFEKENAGKK